jgi:two-component system NtrC family response regulator
MAEVLIIDDDEQMCTLLSETVRRMSHHAVCSVTLQQGLETAVSGQFDVVLLDVNMPDGSGLDMIPRIRASAASPEVIIITGAGDPDGAEIAIKNGAWDYLQKPLSPKTIHLPINRVVQYRDSLKTAAQTTVALKRK